MNHCDFNLAVGPLEIYAEKECCASLRFNVGSSPWGGSRIQLSGHFLTGREEL